VTYFKRLISRFSSERGVTLVEYALLLALMSLALIGALTELRNDLFDFLTTITDRLDDAE
jgi:Flp pilus assembly pilin Flp